MAWDFLSKGAVKQIAATLMNEAAKLRLMRHALEDISQMPCGLGTENCGAARRAREALAEAERIK